MASRAAVSGAPVGRVPVSCSREKSPAQVGGHVRPGRMLLLSRCAGCGASLVPIQASTGFDSAAVPNHRHVAALQPIPGSRLSKPGCFISRVRASPTVSQRPLPKAASARGSVTTAAQKSSGDSGTDGPRSAIAQSTREHVVGLGDTVYGLSRKYGCSVEAILKLNPVMIQDSDNIFPNDVILIPAAPGAVPASRPDAQEALRERVSVQAPVNREQAVSGSDRKQQKPDTKGGSILAALKGTENAGDIRSRLEQAVSGSDGKQQKPDTTVASGSGPTKGSAQASRKATEITNEIEGEAQNARSATQKGAERKGSVSSSEPDAAVRGGVRTDLPPPSKAVPVAKGREEASVAAQTSTVKLSEKAEGVPAQKGAGKSRRAEENVLNSPSAAAAAWIQEVVANDPLVEVGPEMIVKRIGSSGSALSSKMSSSLRRGTSGGRTSLAGQVSTTETLLPPMPPESFTVKKGALWGAGIAAVLALLVYFYQRLRGSGSQRVITQSREIKLDGIDQHFSGSALNTGDRLPHAESSQGGGMVMKGIAGGDPHKLANKEKGRGVANNLQPKSGSRNNKLRFQDVLTQMGDGKAKGSESNSVNSADVAVIGGRGLQGSRDLSDSGASGPGYSGNALGITAATASVAAVGATLDAIGVVEDDALLKPSSTVNSVSVPNNQDDDAQPAGAELSSDQSSSVVDVGVVSTMVDELMEKIAQAENNTANQGEAVDGKTDGEGSDDVVNGSDLKVPGANVDELMEKKNAQVENNTANQGESVDGKTNSEWSDGVVNGSDLKVPGANVDELMEKIAQDENNTANQGEAVDGKTDSEWSDDVVNGSDLKMPGDNVDELMEEIAQAENNTANQGEAVDGKTDGEWSDDVVNGSDLKVPGANEVDGSHLSNWRNNSVMSSVVQGEGNSMSGKGRDIEGGDEDGQEAGKDVSTLSTATEDEEVEESSVCAESVAGETGGDDLIAEGVDNTYSDSGRARANIAEREDDSSVSGVECDDDLVADGNELRDVALLAEEKNKTTPGTGVNEMMVTKEEEEVAELPSENLMEGERDETLSTNIQGGELEGGVNGELQGKEEAEAMVDPYEIARQDIDKKVKAALPVLILGVGGLGALAGVAGVLQVVGLAATATVASQVVWAEQREKLLQDLTEIKDHESLMQFLRARKLVKDC